MRYNPFNPTIPPRPAYFVGRQTELEAFEQNLVQTIHGSPLNMAVVGNRGMGKTSLLVKMEEIAKRHRCLVFRMSNYEGSVNSIAELTDYLILGLKNELFSSAVLTSKIEEFGEWVKALRPIVTYKEIGISVQEKQMAAQVILRNNFLGFWKKIEGEYPAIVLLIDEAESLERIEGALSFLREIFQRLAQEAKYLVVLSGKLNFAERMSESFSPLNRFFPVYPLTCFTQEEVSSYLDIQLKSVGVECDDEVKREIFLKSQGHPYVAVKMAAMVFNELSENEQRITPAHFHSAYSKTVSELEKDFFSPMFHPLSPRAKQVLLALAKHLHETSFKFKRAVEITKMERNQLAPYIQELVRKGCLNKPERASYEFFHPLFLAFLKKKNDEFA